jgi:hypothetical protein
LFVEDRGIPMGRVVWGPRVGLNVGTDRHWRVYALESEAVSLTRSSPLRRTPTPARIKSC